MIITTIIIIIRSPSPWLKIIAFPIQFAEQFAMELATYMHPGSAAQPAVLGPTHKLAFYNVGWQFMSKKHNAAWLAREVLGIVTERNVDAIGISEVFSQKNDDLKGIKENIMSELLAQLNRGSAAQPAWQGRTDAHYIFLWNSNRLCLVDYEVVSCGIKSEPSRTGQYFKFQPRGSDVHLHVYHNHAPSTKLTLGKKKATMKAFWTHVMAKSSVAQPAVVFGGDYNCRPLHWTMCLTEMNSSMNSRKTVQSCESKTDPRTGDTALVMNATAFQEESRFGKSYNPNSFTDAHDVVLVPLHFPYKDTPSSVAQPASNRRTDREAQKAKVPYPVSKEPVPQGATASAAQPGKLKLLRDTGDTASVPKEAIANIAEAKKLEQLDPEAK